MKLAKVLFSFCVIVELSECVERRTPTRSRVRPRSYDRSERQIKPASVPLDVIALTLQAQLDKVEKFNERIVNVLAVLDGKIDKINDKLLTEKINNDETPSIIAQLVSWERKINELDHKINVLINQNQQRFDEERKQEISDEPLILKIAESPTNVESMVKEIKDSLKQFEEKVQHNLSENRETLSHIERTIADSRLNKNSSTSDEFSMQIQRNQRKERRISGEANLINKILTVVNSVVKKKQKSEDEEQTDSVSSLTDMISSFENMKSQIVAKNKTLPSATSRGITFPNVKNKPAKLNTTFTSEAFGNRDVRGFSCVELMNAGMRQSGVYYLQIRGTTYWFLKVFCEQEIADGGWTVIQRRDDFGEPRENFNRDWADYKNGFGDPAKEFWMGNENIFMLTNHEDYALRIELEDFEGNKRYAQYSHFKIHSEADYYKLEIDGYEGNAGDSLNDLTYGSNNSPFSTYNRDNDRSSLNCASMLKGAWWWKSCGRGLNGIYPHDSNDVAAKQGIIWFTWNGWDYTLKKSTMMIKPVTKSMTL